MSTPDFADFCLIAGDVSRETFESLVELDGMLHRWNSRINLVAPSTLSDSWQRHILDSAQLWPLMDDVTDVADLGSGGGFPGLVLATLLKIRPEGMIRLVESNRKKAAFLQTVTGTLGLPATTVAQRIEIAVKNSPAPQLVTARALACLSGLLELAEDWFLAGSRGLFHKGRDYEREVKESSAKWRFDLIEHPSQIAADSVVLEISNVSKR